MFLPMRMATAAVLALALAALPVVLDRCAESCDAHPHAIASTPSCHHATSTKTRIRQVPARCGHDHNGTAVTPALRATPAGRSVDSMVAAVGLPGSLAPVTFDRRVPIHAPPGPSSLTPDHRSLPLRI